MDPRKIQFLIAMQREIDKVELREGESSTRVERLKSRFYDVVEVAEMVGGDKKEYSAENNEDRNEEFETGPTVDKTESPANTESEMTLFQQLKNGSTEQNRSTEVEGPDSVNKDFEKFFPHKPKDVASFLVRFRQGKNRGLKFLTHRWSDMKKENSLTYEEVVENAKSEFQECIDLYTIPETLKAKVREFVKVKSSSGVNKKGYPFKHPRFFYSVVNKGKVERVTVDSGWSSDEMIQWVKDNPQSDPNQDRYWNEKLIQPFKRAIEIRDGMFEEYLRMNAEAVLKERYQQFNPIYGDSLEDVRFFTDVPVLFEGIRQLLDAAKDKAKEPALRFELIESTSAEVYATRQIKIMTDKNPKIGSLVTKRQLIGGNFEEAYDHFYGLCNWSILCQRGKEYVRINLLSDIEGIEEIEQIESWEVEGFTHILTFYDL